MKKHTFFAIFSFFVITSACAPRLTSMSTQAKISIFGTSPTSLIPIASPTPLYSTSPTWTPPPVDVELAEKYESKAPDYLALWGVWGKTYLKIK